MNAIIALAIQILPFILIFYFLLIRPQKKQQKQISDMLSSLKVGDEIVTVGGVVGKIIRIKDDDIFIETGLVGDRCNIRFQKAAVGKVLKSAYTSESSEKTTQNSKKDSEFED